MTSGVEMVVAQVDGLADRPPPVRVRGAAAGAAVTLTAETRDAAGHAWRSTATYRAGPDGDVDLARDAPVRGDYDGVDPTGLFWSMRFVDRDVAPTAYATPIEGARVSLVARADQGEDRVEILQRWAADGVTHCTVSGDRFVGRLYDPAPGTPASTPVLVVPGSTGAAAVEPWAALWASHGHPAMVAAYMEEPGLPDSLREVPVEALQAGLRYLSNRYGGRPVAVVSFSVGTEGALSALTTARDVPVAAVLAVAPSQVIWQALGHGGPPPRTASWARDGAPLDWVPMRGEKLVPQVLGQVLRRLVSRRPRVTALRLRPAYEAGLTDSSSVAAAAIPVERIDAPLLLISGEEDAMWPAPAMAAALLRRRQDAGVDHGDEHLCFADAGHFLRAPVTPTSVTWNDTVHSGGTARGCARAAAEGWARMRSFVPDVR